MVVVVVRKKGGAGKKEDSKTDCRVSALSTANPLGGAEASSVWIRAQHSCVGRIYMAAVKSARPNCSYCWPRNSSVDEVFMSHKLEMIVNHTVMSHDTQLLYLPSFLT